MKTIGLIGGMSWESSIEYYRILNEQIKEKLGGLHSAQCILSSVDFGPIEKWMRNEEWDKITDHLCEVAINLEKAGANLIIICTNTMHKLLDAIQLKIQIPIYHIADAAADKIKDLGLTKVGLLGTRFTMEGDFYKKRLLDQHHIEVIVPNPDERREVDHIIFEELVLGKITDPAREVYKQVIRNLQKKGAQGIILGCTEIPLLIKPQDSPIPVFDTTQLHAEFAVKKALEL
ncbi:aspartate/glutamate racemase family protein [Candidatus Lokiarchaeum ossiferum]|uniref:aspartate/glutamate racemase family protein n=1 Tax=Candidatus Lokiarchaeum ossiferum TaxID=2951803 RepID=UPI00352C0E54